MLRRRLAGSEIETQVFSEGRERGYKGRGELTIGKLIRGAATNTSDLVAPTGFVNWWDISSLKFPETFRL